MLVLPSRKQLIGTPRNQEFNMHRNQKIVGAVVALVLFGAGLYLWKINQNKSEQTPVTPVVTEQPINGNTNANQIEQTNAVPDTTTESTPGKSEAVIKNGKRITYSNQEFGLSFIYNREVYQAPILLSTKEAQLPAEYGKTYLSLNDNLIPDVETAKGHVSIYKMVGKSESFIDQEVKRLASTDCKVISKNNIDGQKAFWYECPGMGDTQTVLIWHPKGYILMLDIAFPYIYSDELVKSIKLLI
jgi:hypothetical protein